MKNYLMVSREDLVKLLDGFTDIQEMDTFVRRMSDLIDEMLFTSLMVKRVDEASADTLFLKNLCLFACFCRENIEVIHHLIRNLNTKSVSEDELKRFGEEECSE